MLECNVIQQTFWRVVRCSPFPVRLNNLRQILGSKLASDNEELVREEQSWQLRTEILPVAYPLALFEEVQSKQRISEIKEGYLWQ